MKIDINYIENILTAISDCDNNDCPSLHYICNTLNIANDELSMSILKFHLSILRDGGFLESQSQDFGIMKGMNGNIILNSSVGLRLTFNGHNLLESISNKTLWNKTKSGLKEISVETLKQIPAIALNWLLSLK